MTTPMATAYDLQKAAVAIEITNEGDRPAETLDHRPLCLFVFRPWSDDQTLFVKHLEFVCKSKCFTVWLRRHKRCLSNIFHLRQAKNVFKIFQKHHATNSLCLSSNVL